MTYTRKGLYEEVKALLIHHGFSFAEGNSDASTLLIELSNGKKDEITFFTQSIEIDFACGGTANVNYNNIQFVECNLYRLTVGMCGFEVSTGMLKKSSK